MPKFDLGDKLDTLTGDLKKALTKARNRKYPQQHMVQLRGLIESAKAVTKRFQWEDKVRKKIHEWEMKLQKFIRKERAAEKREKKKLEGRRTKSGRLLAIKDGKLEGSRTKSGLLAIKDGKLA